MLIKINCGISKHYWDIPKKPVNWQQLANIHEITPKNESFQIKLSKTSGMVTKKYIID